jgi:valyl-tRNA synthetase
VDALIELVQALRRWRDHVEAAPGRQLPAAADGLGLEAAEHVGRLARLAWTTREEQPIATVGPVAIYASEAVDLEAEARRADARRTELRSEIARSEGKLANERFVQKAPEHVVAAEREKLERLRRDLDEVS